MNDKADWRRKGSLGEKTGLVTEDQFSFENISSLVSRTQKTK